MASQPIEGELDRVQILTNTQIYFDSERFSEAIVAHGVLMVHFRAFRCPGGMVDIDDSRHPNECHLGCSNGFIYTMAGKLNVLFTGNSDSPTIQDIGVLDGSSAQVTFPGHYDSGDPAWVACFDRLYLAEENIVVPEWELVETHITGQDRLRRPAVLVQDLVDSAGNSYKQHVDFEVSEGQVKWVDGHGPGMDAETGKGKIYAIRYLYRPYFYIKHISHEIRVAQVDDPISGERRTAKMPQSVTIQREYQFENEQKDPDAKHPESWRQQRGPREGSFGPR